MRGPVDKITEWIVPGEWGQVNCFSEIFSEKLFPGTLEWEKPRIPAPFPLSKGSGEARESPFLTVSGGRRIVRFSDRWSLRYG